MFRLAHLSDVHLGPLPEITYRELASKRITGYVNWQRNRKRHMHDKVIDDLTADIVAAGPDHVAITGDLVNLALDAEIAFAHEWLKDLGAHEGVTVIPGNHDAYVPGALAKACRSWAGWMTGDDEPAPTGRESFPFMRVRGPMALIGTSSARSSAPFMASGYFREKQGRQLGRMLDEAGRRGLFRVVLIHHPPVRGAAPPHKRLFGISRFQRIIQAHGADLVLHGHTHLPTVYWIAGKDAPVPVVGVTAAGQGFGGAKPPAQYNLFEVSGDARRGFGLRLTRRGLSVPGAAIMDLVTQDLARSRETAIVQLPEEESEPADA